MAGPVVVQSKIGLATAANTLSISFDSLPTVGSTVAIKVATWNNNVAQESVADNQGNTWTLRGYLDDGTTGSASIWMAKANTSSGTFTVTVSQTTSHLSGVIEEYDGEVEIDGTQGELNNTSAVTSTSFSVGTAATSDALELMVINPYNDLSITAWTSPLALLHENTAAGSASCVIGAAAGSFSSSGAKNAACSWTTASPYVAVAMMVKFVSAAAATNDALFFGAGV